jgi:hypothetical protein
MHNIIEAHLELVSVKTLTDDRDELKALLKKRPGVYALYKRDRLKYVGQAKNLFGRLDAHRRDRHKGTWDRFSAYVTTEHEFVHEVEALALRMVNPVSNRRLGRFGSSRNLTKDLKELIVDKHTREVDDLFVRRRSNGSRSASKSAGKSANRARTKGGLEKINGVRRNLRGNASGNEYRGVLLRDGGIQVGDTEYPSPFASACAAAGKRRNGWNFWKYKDASGEWQQLRNLLSS